MKYIYSDIPRITAEWEGNQIDERLRLVLAAIAFIFGGIRLTCLIRSYEENKALISKGAKDNSLHVVRFPQLCRAADFNPNYGVKNAEHWRERVATYVKTHFRGVDVVVQPHGTAPHVHLEIDPKAGEVEILA